MTEPSDQSAAFPQAWRRPLLGLLVAAFAVQTLLVYADDTGRTHPALSDLARQGRAVWHERGCQVCHQVHGFGGFIGPDLTNAVRRIDDKRLQTVLTVGPDGGRMPAFDLGQDDISAVKAWLEALDETGVGQARRAVASGLPEYVALITRLTKDGSLGEREARGAVHLTGFCSACHLPLRSNQIGTFFAPDLSLSVKELSEEELAEVLTVGRPAKGMPPPPLTDAMREDVVAFLMWTTEHRAELAAELGIDRSQALPWWEYR